MGTFTEKYRVLQKIGEGSFSEVLKCEDKITGKQYAAKRLKKYFRSTTDAMNCAEIVAMHKLTRHPNVVYMLEFFYDTSVGSLVYIFELMDLSMYDFMKTRKRPVPEVKVKWYLFQMLKGLEHLHKNGLFHRDIKPENILVKIGPRGENSKYLSELVKLADLGSIRGVYSRQPYTEYISTRWYRSPECLLSVGYYGPKMDIWAAGCVFYEMLTLQPLFPGTNEIDQLSKIHAVLGSPSSRLIMKIKKKSHNCQMFPRQIGCGLKTLMHNFTDDAQTILKLMVQYDPETRINVRRLVEHRYFASLRQQHLITQFKYNTIQNNLNVERCNRGRGDHETVTSFVTGSDRWKQSKYQNINTRLMMPRPRRIDNASKTSPHIDKLPAQKPFARAIIDSKKELLLKHDIRKVSQAVSMTPIESPKKERKYVHRFQQTIRTHPPTDCYRKTTTNLPNTFSKNKSALDNSKQKQFYSKSFVIPRMSKFKVDSVSDNWIDKVVKLNLSVKK